MANYKIINGTILTCLEKGLKTEEKTVFVRDGRISFQPFSEDEDFEVVDARRKLIMPGLINMHTHSYMTMMRNYADDVPFTDWLFNRVMPVEDNLPVEAAYWTSLLGCLEMITTGTTCFVDMHMYHRQAALAARDAGMRAYIGRGLVGEDLYGDGYSRYQQAMEEKEEFASDRLNFLLSPHAIYTCSEKLLVQIGEAAKKDGFLKQIHLSESMTEIEDCYKAHGKSPVAYLKDIGFLDADTILAHCVQMQKGDLDIIRNCGATIVTNVASNAKLGNGIAPLVDMREAGINVCVGTDGAASNNTLNMFREMGLMSLMHKAHTRDCLAIPSDYIVQMATCHAGKALKDKNIGSIHEGARADLVFVDLDSPSLFPNNNIISSLCYSANGSEVDSVMINGSFVMKNRDLLTIDKERVFFEVSKIVEANLIH